MNARERAKQAIESSTIPPQHSQWWAILISPAQVEMLTHSIEQAIIAAEEEATKKERARSLELIKRCRVMYERLTNEEREKTREAQAKNPSAKPLPLSPFYLNSAEQTYCDRAMGCEYAEMVVREVDLDSNMMPMAF